MAGCALTMPDQMENQKKTAEVVMTSETDIRPPDGGWGWVICFATFMTNFTTTGMTSSNGILLLGILDLYEESVAKSSIVGSIFAGTTMFGGPFVLVLIMFKASHRQVMMAGGLIAAVSCVASAFAPNVETLIVTYGILTGFSVAMNFFAANVMLGCYFSKKRALALGIAGSGAGCGGILLTYLTEKSISFYGTRGTFILIGGLFLNLTVYGALFRPLKPVIKKNCKIPENIKSYGDKYEGAINPVFVVENEIAGINVEKHDGSFQENNSEKETRTNNELRRRKMSTFKDKVTTGLERLKTNYCDVTMFQNKIFCLLLLIYFLWAVGDSLLIYLPAYAESIGLSREEGALNMSIFGITSTIIPILVGFLADVLHIPISYLLLTCLMALSFSILALPFCNTFVTLVSGTVILSIGYSFGTSLRIVMIAGIIGVKKMSEAYTIMTMLIGVGYTLYPIISGIVYDATHFFPVIFYMDFALAFLGAILSCGTIYAQKTGKFAE